MQKARTGVRSVAIQYKCAEQTDRRSAGPTVSEAASPTMGRKVLVAVVCWITLSKSWVEAKKTIKLEDSLGQTTIPHLYRNIPVGVYASASPYAAFSFHVPTFASSPKLGPIKQESVIVENTHGFLKDSYGNKFVDSPRTLSYKTTFPQQFVQLQELPAHLAQPLVSAAPSFQYKQVTPHFFGPTQYKVQALQAALPATANRYAINQPYAFNGAIRALAQAQQQQQQHPTSNQAVYANTHSSEQFLKLKNVPKSQRLEDIADTHKENGPVPQVTQRDNMQIKAAATSAKANKGKKAVINLVTNPPVPLLDLSLLEPLTFANPLVPQVQHFLPRINSVTYHKLPQPHLDIAKKEMNQFLIQNTKSYDTGVIKDNPKVSKHKKTQTKPQSDSEETYHEQLPLSPTRLPDVSNVEPEISYEINSPNYKETYKEKVVSYNKETQSEPVHYNYEKKIEKEPVHYNYVHTSKDPQVKNVHYKNKGENPKHLIYNFKPQQNNEDKSDNNSHQRNEHEDSSEKSEEDEISSHQRKQNQGQPYDNEHAHRYERPEHREEENNYSSDKISQHNIQHNSPQEYSQVINTPVENNDANFRPIITEYEENIRIIPTPKQYATIKVNPNQHIQPTPVLLNHNSREQQSRQQESSHIYPDSQQRTHYHPDHHVHHEKSKRVVIKEELPEGKPINEQVNKEVVTQNEEEDFETGYKNAAFGFPAYETASRDSEKEIYNPDTYGHSQYQTDYDIEHSPFQQYQLEGDEFPKTTRSNYKDERDKTKEDYYLDYAISKPESIVARYREKEDYYKMFMKRKPQYLSNERQSDKKNQKLIAKNTAAPVYEYNGSVQKPKQYFAKYKVAPQPPQVYEYDYSKEAPKDNSAHATRPYQRLKAHTQFVEPQFQYGFEPSSLPRLLDSELAAMASNDSPESENPGSRKKIYKENWYIKKTSTNDRKAAR